MRPLSLVPLLTASTLALGALALGACASSGGTPSASYTQEIDKLRAACEARNGTLQPTGRISGNPALDNPCRIREATNIPPQ